MRGNTFGAHIFKRRSVGEREEVTIKLFKPDGSPLEVGETPDLSNAVLAAWKGDYNTNLDYAAGSLVRNGGKTYLATTKALSTDLDPGQNVTIAPISVNGNGPRAGYNLPRDVDAVLSTLVGPGGYNLPGPTYWFRISGTPGEQITLTVTGGGNPNMHLYKADGTDLSGGTNFGSPQVVTIPATGYFGIEVSSTATLVKYVGPSGPQPIPGNPWVLFA